MTYYKPTRLELLIFLGIMLAMGVIGHQLYQHLQASSRVDVDPSKRLGQILFVQGDVRIRPSDSFMWDDARANLYIAEKDKIFNGAGGKAKILLVDNTAIELGPNTLVQFFRDKEGAVGIDVASGRLNIDSALTDKDKLSQLMVDTQALDCTGIDVEFEGGSTDIRELQKRIACRQMIQREALTYRPVSPSTDDKLYGDQPFALKWRKMSEDQSAPEEGLRLIIEKLEKDSFKVAEKISLEAIERIESYDHTGLEPGTYHWYLESKNTKLSRAQPFRVLAVPFPTLLEPKENAVVYGEVIEAPFKWQRKFGAERTRLQIAADPQFSKVLVDQETTYTGYELSEAEAKQLTLAKTFYWRLIPILAEFDLLKHSQITIPQQKTQVVSAASQIFPPHDFVFDESPLNMQTVKFQWPEVQTQQYGFELVDINSRILSSGTTPVGETTVERLPPGSYRWTVSRMDDRLPKAVLFSYEFDIIAKLSAEELAKISADDISYAIQQNGFSPLKWDVEFKFQKTNFVLENFELAFVTSRDATQAVEPDPQIGGKKQFIYRELEPGTYQLQLTQKGTRRVALTLPVDLTASPIGPPPDMHLVLEAREKDHVLRLNWPRVDMAQSYQIKIFRRDDHGTQHYVTEKVLTTETSSLTLLEDPELADKRLMIVAISVDPVGRQSLPIQKDFHLTQ